MARNGVRWALALAVTLAASSAFRPALAADPRCAAPDGVAGTVASLPHVAATLRPGSTLDVLVVGSATVFGPAAALEAGAAAREAVRNGQLPGTTTQVSGPRLAVVSPAAFPMVMARGMQAAVPGMAVKVTVEGGRSLTAADMVETLRKALANGPRPQLVILQTGTLEAVRNVQPGDFAQSLADSQQLARDAGADLVLVDPQYSRFLQTNANLDPYLQAFGTTAAVAEVVWFHRFDLMRHWVSTGQIDLEHTPKAERHAAVELLHSCLGNSLAQLVVDSARS